MIDDKKIEEEATNYAQDGYNNYDDNIQRVIEESFKSGATWMQEEFLKALWHPASEEPKNLEYIIYPSDIFGVIYFFTIKKDNSILSWETEVAYHGIDQWAYKNDIVSLILKGGKQ